MIEPESRRLVYPRVVRNTPLSARLSPFRHPHHFLNKLALRNLFRHRVRSMVTLSAIAFSTIVLVIAAGFIEWIFSDLRTSTIETGLGHLQVVRHDYYERGVADPYAYLLPEKSPLRGRIEAMPHVAAVGSRLEFSGLLSFNDASLSFVGLGVEPTKEAVLSRNLTFLSGSNLVADSANEIVVGEGLAANLGLSTGDRVVLLINTTNGSVNATEATVRGVFTTQIRAFDEVALRVPLAMARKLLRTTGAHQWIVSLDDIGRVDETRDAINAIAPGADFDVYRWVDLSDFYTKTVTFLSGQLGVMRALIAVIIVLGVSNMLIMNVLERTGEIGTLMAMGVRRRKVVSLFLVESLYLGLIGGILGIGLALVFAKIISSIGVPMPPPPGRTSGYIGAILVTWPILASAFAVTLGTTLIAAIYPARKASRLVIVDALRYNR